MDGTVSELIDAAGIIEREHGVDLALAFLAQCAERAETEEGAQSVAVGALLNQMGTVNRSCGRYAVAAGLFERARDALAAAVGTGDVEYATALMNLAGVWRLQGRAADSLPLFEEALAIYGGEGGEESVLYLTALNNIALSYQDLGENAAALRRHLQVCAALEAASEEGRSVAVEYATSLCNTGLCFVLEGEAELGRELVERALEVYGTALPENHFLVRRARQMLDEGLGGGAGHAGA